MMNRIKVWLAKADLFVEDVFSERRDSEELVYDPLHVGMVIVLAIFFIGVLYWLLWSLLVCEGGIFIKIIPFLKVVFTRAVLKDYGYEGYPYELGIFEGWIVNLSALVITAVFIAGIWRVFKDDRK